MKNLTITLTILFFTLISVHSLAQRAPYDYDDPITVYTQEVDKPISRFDVAIDNHGVIHCVMSIKIASNFYKIFYIKSEDDGISWTEPIDISNNNEKWVTVPKIVCDTVGHLYVVFTYDVGDYSKTKVVFKKFDGEYWSTGDTITQGMNGATDGLITLSNSKVYCFFSHYHTICYKIFENGIWSQTYKICEGANNNRYYAYKVVTDDNGNLHCIGSHTSELSSGTPIVFYTKYENEVWSDLILFSDTTSLDMDICIDNENEPHIVWREQMANVVPPISGFYYSEYRDGSWLHKKLLNASPTISENAIIADANNEIKMVNSVTQKLRNDSYYFHRHYRYYNGRWFNYELEYGSYLESTPTGKNLLVKHENTIYLFYIRLIDTIINNNNEYLSSIYLRKKTTETDDIEISKIPDNIRLNVYPNPTNNEINIEFYLNKPEQVKIGLYDMSGKLIEILSDKPGTQGNNLLTLKSKALQRKEVNTGFYIIKLSYGKNCYSQRIVFN